jgi:DNA-binding beta-propeller fold protein YncE/mono/diheme cytochrome c family protein
MRRVAVCGLLGIVTSLPACGGAPPTGDASVTANAAAAGQALRCERQNPGVGAARADGARQSSAVALARLGGSTFAYVADEDSMAIHTMDVDRRAEVATTKLDGSPAQVIVLADGRVAVTLRDKNRVQILEPAARPSAPLEPRCSMEVAVEPFGLAATPDDRLLLVTSAFGQKLTAFEAATMRKSFDVKLAREPRAILVDDTGERAFVAHVVGAKMSVVDLVGEKHEVREVDLRVKRVVGTVAARNNEKQRSGCQGFALAKAVQVEKDPPKDVPHGEKPLQQQRPAPKAAAPKPKGRVFAPMVTVEPGDANVRSAAYYGDVFDGVGKEAPIVSVIDAEAERPLTKNVMTLGTRVTQECLLPRSAAVRGSTGNLYVSCLGIDAVVELDTRGLDPARLELRRWSVPSGPTGVAIDDRGSRAVVWSQFDGKVSFIDLSDGATQKDVKLAKVAYAPTPERAELAVGRKLFHMTDDKRISSDGTACASCHPDGREDAITWATPDGPRQTIMLAARMQKTAPFGWLGKHDTVHNYLSNTFQRLGGTGLIGQEFDALVHYVQAMPGPKYEGEPALDDAASKLAARGKTLFYNAKQGCATCHVGGVGVDKEGHDVGSRSTADVDKTFDTPSLRFVRGTAPYFHDGRYATLEALLNANDNQMGHTMNLSQRDVAALKAYLETL